MTIYGIDSLAVNGRNALSYATIVTETNSGVFNAVINQTSSNEYNIYCNSSDICKIECQTSGCEELCLYCFGTCTVICDEDYGIDCPSCGFNYTIRSLNTTQQEMTTTTTTTSVTTRTMSTTVMSTQTSNSTTMPTTIMSTDIVEPDSDDCVVNYPCHVYFVPFGILLIVVL